MINHSEASTFHTNIPLVESTDLVQGGISGNSNAATKLLANRTRYLYNALGNVTIASFSKTALADIVLTANGIHRTLIRYVVDFNDNSGSISLPTTADVPDGEILDIVIVGDYVRPVKIQTFINTQYIFTPILNSDIQWLYPGERLTLYKIGTGWEILSHVGNMLNVLKQHYGYWVEPGTLKRDGVIQQRAQYPRLWRAVSSISSPSIIANDTTWTTGQGGNVHSHKGFFSSGNGTDSFRPPDDRGWFDRALDFGANVDIDRYAAGLGIYNLPGHTQMDIIKKHVHPVDLQQLNSAGPTGSGKLATGNETVEGTIPNIDTEDNTGGGNETRPKNRGKIPLLIY